MKNNIRVERAIKRMTQQQLAEKTGVTRQTINAIEAGKYVPLNSSVTENIGSIREETRGSVPTGRNRLAMTNFSND